MKGQKVIFDWFDQRYGKTNHEYLFEILKGHPPDKVFRILHILKYIFNI